MRQRRQQRPSACSRRSPRGPCRHAPMSSPASLIARPCSASGSSPGLLLLLPLLLGASSLPLPLAVVAWQRWRRRCAGRAQATPRCSVRPAAAWPWPRARWLLLLGAVSGAMSASQPHGVPAPEAAAQVRYKAMRVEPAGGEGAAVWEKTCLARPALACLPAPAGPSRPSTALPLPQVQCCGSQRVHAAQKPLPQAGCSRSASPPRCCAAAPPPPPATAAAAGFAAAAAPNQPRLAASSSSHCRWRWLRGPGQSAPLQAGSRRQRAPHCTSLQRLQRLPLCVPACTAAGAPPHARAARPAAPTLLPPPPLRPRSLGRRSRPACRRRRQRGGRQYQRQ